MIKRLAGLAIALLIFASPATVSAKTDPWSVVKKIDSRFYFIQNSGASSFTFEFQYSGLDEFLDKKLDSEAGEKKAPVFVEWKKKYGSNVVYRSQLPVRLRQAGILIVREYKDLYIQPTLTQSLRGFTLAAQRYKNGETHIKAVLKSKAVKSPFFRIELVCDASYKVLRMAFFTHNGAQITQTWDVKSYKGKFVPTKVTTVNKFQKKTIVRQVLYEYQTKNGFYFPLTATVKTRTSLSKSKIETVRFKNLVIK